MEQMYDVIVVGAGPSGIAASISAAKNGAKTLLIERETLIGGCASRYYISTLKGHAAGWMQESIDDLLTRAWGFCIFSTEELIDRYYKLLSDHHVSVHCGHEVTNVHIRNQHITGIETNHCDTKHYFKASVVIDATGGRLCHIIDEAVDNRRERRYGMTALVGRVESVGGRCYSREARQLLLDRVNHAKDEKKLLESLKLDIKPTIRGDMALMHVTVEMADGRYEDCRKQIFRAMAYLRKFGYGFENANIITTSKHIDDAYPLGNHAKYQLDEEDILNGRVFSRWAASGLQCDLHQHHRTIGQEKAFCVPYDALLHRSVDNLLLCGRSIGVTDGAAPWIDGIPIHHATGQAAGTVAAWFVHQRSRVEDVDLPAVQQTLVQQGMDHPKGEGVDTPQPVVKEEPIKEDTVKQEIMPALVEDQATKEEDASFDQFESSLIETLYGNKEASKMEDKDKDGVKESPTKKITPSVPFMGNELNAMVQDEAKEDELSFFDEVQASLEHAEIDFRTKLKEEQTLIKETDVENEEEEEPQPPQEVTIAEEKAPEPVVIKEETKEVHRPDGTYIKKEEDLFIEVLPFEGLEKLGIKEDEIPEEDMIMTLFIPDEDEQINHREAEESEDADHPLAKQPPTLEIPKETIVDDPQDAYFTKEKKQKNVLDEVQWMNQVRDDNWSEFKSLLDVLPDQLPDNERE